MAFLSREDSTICDVRWHTHEAEVYRKPLDLPEQNQTEINPIQTKMHHLLNVITILLFTHSINSRWISPSSMPTTQGFSSLPWQGQIQLLASWSLLTLLAGCTIYGKLKIFVVTAKRSPIRQKKKNHPMISSESHRTYINYLTFPKTYFFKK